MRRWQRAAGPFWLYVGATPFLGDLTASAPNRETYRRRLPALFAAPGPAALFVVDLPAATTLNWTEPIRRIGLIVVPAIHRWCTPGAVLPCERLIDGLVARAPYRLSFEPSPERGVVILLDGERGGRTDVRISGRRFDNRYVQNPDLLPPASLLQRESIGRVCVVSERASATDLGPYLSQLAAAGLEIEEVALARSNH